MNNQPIPETKGFYVTAFDVEEWAEKCIRLEKERDEAREAFVIATDQMVIAQGKVREANKERDEAREALNKILKNE